jgi:tetratricopeptide (TPR) repeat protein
VLLKVYDEAIKHYSHAIDADPNYAEAFYNRGLCYETVGNIMAAREDYQRATQLKPDYKVAEDGLKRVSQ